jgi:glycosyltransferase involved in cell wall biosynthesis
MFKGQKVVVVMPAYNAEKTLRKTYREVMDQEIVDEVIVVDDASRDDTVAVAIGLLAVRVEVHENNKGYGANQKTCYRLALDAGADIVIMVHPDYQYTPKLIPAMAAMIGNGLVPLCDRVAYPREICLTRRYAFVEVRCQSFPPGARVRPLLAPGVIWRCQEHGV